ncbi:hypothetical protein EON65_06415 [archaeon]|nr:MAG: hypothetical protein EON65_06415 [archaeon]
MILFTISRYLTCPYPYPYPYTRYQNYDLAAELLAENAALTYKYLSQEQYDYLDACIMVPTSVEEAYRKFDELANKLVDFWVLYVYVRVCE